MKTLYTFLIGIFFSMGVCAEPTKQMVTLHGNVTDEVDNSPLPGVVISIPELSQGVTTDENGNYQLVSLPRKIITVQVSYLGHQTIIRQIDLNKTTEVNFVMKESNAMINEVVVTGLTGKSLMKESSTPISVLTSNEIQAISSTNIIDAIAHQPGISQITTGSGISKPVIRGLGYNRIVTVNDGVRQEGQQWGDEHGIEIDAQSVNQIEILKGPASLMYGSDALAGVVIFHDAPTLPMGQMKASVTSEYQTNNGLFDYSFNFAGNKSGNVWNVRYSDKMAHAYKNKYDGYVLNSQFRERAFSALGGIIRAWGYSHLKLSYYHLTPSVIEGERDEMTGQFVKPVMENGEVSEIVADKDDLKSYGKGLPYQQIHHYKAIWDNSVYVGDGLIKALVGYQQNRRQEFEEVEEPNKSGLDFMLHTVNYDLHYLLPEHNGWKMAAGLNGMYQRSLNNGDEYLIPAYSLFDIGAFATASFKVDKWNLSGGLRLDNRHLHSYALEDRFDVISRNFSGVTGSIGAVYSFTDNMHFRVNAARGYRAPNMSELGSNGEHEGTFRYEIGNANLKPEYSWQIDAGMDYSSSFVSMQLSLFANFIQNYIFSSKNGAQQDDLDVYKFTQGDARLLGGEVSVDIHPVEKLHFQNSFSYVNAVQNDQPTESKYLPLTPAPRWTSDLCYDIIRDGKMFNNFFVRAEMECNMRQNHFYAAGDTETATPSYTLFNISTGTDILNRHGKTIASMFINADNIFNCAYQSHLSRLKYAAVNNVTGRKGVYNMGRNVGFKVVIPVLF